MASATETKGAVARLYEQGGNSIDILDFRRIFGQYFGRFFSWQNRYSQDAFGAIFGIDNYCRSQNFKKVTNM